MLHYDEIFSKHNQMTFFPHRILPNAMHRIQCAPLISSYSITLSPLSSQHHPFPQWPQHFSSSSWNSQGCSQPSEGMRVHHVPPSQILPARKATCCSISAAIHCEGRCDSKITELLNVSIPFPLRIKDQGAGSHC